jgi:hypothetical protein
VPFVLGHRMIVSPEAELAGVSSIDLLDRVIKSVPVPKRREEG